MRTAFIVAISLLFSSLGERNAVSTAPLHIIRLGDLASSSGEFEAHDLPTWELKIKKPSV